MADFLWHKVSEKEKREIEKQAKEIMKSFSKKLSKVGKVSESVIDREDFEREEGKNQEDNFSREVMFENAQRKNKDFIIGEKGSWQ